MILNTITMKSETYNQLKRKRANLNKIINIENKHNDNTNQTTC